MNQPAGHEGLAASFVESGEPLWFLGTLARILVDGQATGGRFALIDLTLPKGAAPPLHSHPEDETFQALYHTFLFLSYQVGLLKEYLKDAAEREAK